MYPVALCPVIDKRKAGAFSGTLSFPVDRYGRDRKLVAKAMHRRQIAYIITGVFEVKKEIRVYTIQVQGVILESIGSRNTPSTFVRVTSTILPQLCERECSPLGGVFRRPIEPRRFDLSLALPLLVVCTTACVHTSTTTAANLRS